MSTAQNHSRENRKLLRMDVRIKGEYRKNKLDKPDSWVPFETESLGSGGLMFHSLDSLSTDDQVDVRLYIEGKTFEAVSKVLRIEPILKGDSPKSPKVIVFQYTKIDPILILKLNNYIFMKLSEKRQR